MDKLARQPISLAEFRHAVDAMFKASGKTKYANIGLAISGGVDSMALACLWNRLTTQWEPPSARSQVLIVDHAARPGSRKEADKTQLTVRHMFNSNPGQGEKARIQTLEWPSGRPESSTRFETEARTLRYQKLGRACFRRGIDTLLVAHHADDKAETILARLASKHRGSGLDAMKEYAQIPESRGIFGVYESGKLARHNPKDIEVKFVGGPEDEGLTIQRPLLSFPKSRLVATCRAARVGWVEDVSNSDPTVTMRNAIRKMFKEEVLPTALHPERLFQLADRIRESTQKYEELVDQIHEASSLRFDIRSGVLSARVPHLGHVFKDDWNDWSYKARRHIAALFLRSLGQCVVPHETLRLQPVENSIDIIFHADFRSKNGKEQDDTAASHRKKHQEPQLIDVGGVIFQKASTTTSEDKGIKWLIYRPPYPAQQVPPPIDFPMDTFDPSVTSFISSTRLMQTVHLWDGRWWIHIYNKGPETVTLVHLLPRFLRRLKKSLNRQDARTLEGLLNKIAPGKARWTLPCIVTMSTPLPPPRPPRPLEGTEDWEPTQKTRNDLESGPFVRKFYAKEVTTREVDMATKRFVNAQEKEKKAASDPELYPNAEIVALPTLGAMVPGWEEKVFWDIRYRKLYLKGLEKEGEGVLVKEAKGGGGEEERPEENGDKLPEHEEEMSEVRPSLCW